MGIEALPVSVDASESAAHRQLESTHAHPLPEELQAVIFESLQKITEQLQPPAQFLLEDYDLQQEDIAHLTRWRIHSETQLQELINQTQQHPDIAHLLAASIFVALARFRIPADLPLHHVTPQIDSWTSPLVSKIAADGSRHFSDSMSAEDFQLLLQEVLSQYLKDCFSRHKHAHVHPQTGRRRHHPKGTNQQHLSRFEEHNDASVEGPQWKGHGFESAIGCWNVFIACLEEIDSSSIESLWPLIVPPLMTLMDDHDPPFRLKGALALSVLLKKCETILIRRTGLHHLAQQSLSTSLTYLSDVHYAPLVQSAFQVNLQLIDCLHPPPYSPIDISEQRFDALCRLMKEGPQHILFFASEKPVFVTIAAQEVKQLTPRLGIAIVRFLQDLLHPLLGVLSFPAPPNTELGQDCIVVVCECIQALLTVTDACPPARRWRGAIISALLKCWIVTIEDGKGDTTRVQKALISLLTSLDQWDPNVCVDLNGLRDKRDTALEQLLQKCSLSQDYKMKQ